MSISTIYRAASRLLEAVNLEWDTVLGDRMQWLFALSVYNGMVTSSQAGFLSRMRSTLIRRQQNCSLAG